MVKEYRVIVVCFGKSSTNGICSILRRFGVKYITLLPDEIPKFEPTHVILSGGPKHVYDLDHYVMPLWVIQTHCPVLGICYGMQLIAHTFQGIVIKMPEIEKGLIEITEIIDHKQTRLLRWMNRNDRVISLPSNFYITGVTSRNHIASFTDYKKWYAVQYHPESHHCKDSSLFRRFLQL